MTDTTEVVRNRIASVSVLRRVAGAVVGLAVAAAAVLFALGVGNPLRLGVLERYFFDPMFGLLLVGVGGYLTLWLLAPIRNEARQGNRIRARLATVVVAVLGLGGWGIFGVFFNQEVTELARTDDGARSLMQVAHANIPDRLELRIWNGSGLTAREAGSLGEACGGLQEVRFVSNDLVELDTSFGTWRFALDPATGEPQQVLGPRCPDGPVPASMGP